MSLLDVYNRYVVELDLALAKMSHAGVLMDLERRATMLADAKQEMTHLMTEMNRVVPDRAKVAEPKLGFFREPKATAGLARRVFNVPVKVCPHCGLEKPSKKDLLRCGLTKEQLVVMAFPVERWCRLRPFVPSNAQVITYQRTMGHPLMYSSKKKPGKGKVKSITADEKALGRLIKKVPADPLYPLILRYRDVEHRIGQIESLTIGPDNRVHTTFLHTPSTLRLASGLPAMQNIPPDLRTLFIPGPGNRLFKVDWSGIEAQLVGYFMGGENGRNYLRLAKLGVHAYFMSHVVGRPASLNWSDADLRECFAELKKDADTYKRAKQTVHACLTPEHEVLTPMGWKRIDALEIGDKVTQYADGGRLTFVHPEARPVYPYVGNMVTVNGRGISTTMTPNHRVPLRRGKNGHVKVAMATNLTQRGAIPISGFMTGCSWVGEAWLPLAVAIQADGSLARDSDRVTFHLVKARKIQRLRKLLQDLGVSYTDMSCGDHVQGRRITFKKSHCGHITTWLNAEKVFQPRIMECSSLAKVCFLEEVLQWDGAIKGSRQEYCSTVRANAEMVQTIAHLTNRQGLFREHPQRDGRKMLYVVSLNKRRWADLTASPIGRLHYEGPVYCLTVPDGFFLVRHNNRISVTGNSNYRETPYGMHMQQPGIFPTVRDAEFYQKLYYEVVPGLTDWHWHTCIEAERDGLLRNPWGFPHRFYDVFRYERNAFTGEWDKFFGIMANAAIAFKPQSTAGMLMRGAILTCAENEELLRALRLTIHDELFGEAEVDKVSRIYYAVKSIMERPIPQLPLDPAWGMGHFLSIETEGKIIDRWAPIPAAVTA